MSGQLPEDIQDRIQKLFEQIRILMQALDLIVHMSVLHGDIKKKISGACTDIRSRCCQIAKMFLLRMRIRNNVLVNCPAPGFSN